MVLKTLLLCCLVVTSLADVSHLHHDDKDHHHDDKDHHHHHHHHHQNHEHHTTNGYQYEKPVDKIYQTSDIQNSPTSDTQNSYSDSFLGPSQYALYPYQHRPSSYLNRPHGIYGPAIQSNYANIYPSGYNKFSDTKLHDESDAVQQEQSHHKHPVTNKNYYYHSAPQDQFINLGTEYVPVGRPQNNYQVIFVRPPSYHAQKTIVPILPKNNDRTVVYVLSKQPTFETKVQVQDETPSKPSKPNVYFINTKSSDEAQQAQQYIQDAFQSGNAVSDATGGLSSIPFIGSVLPQITNALGLTGPSLTGTSGLISALPGTESLTTVIGSTPSLPVTSGVTPSLPGTELLTTVIGSTPSLPVTSGVTSALPGVGSLASLVPIGRDEYQSPTYYKVDQNTQNYYYPEQQQQHQHHQHTHNNHQPSVSVNYFTAGDNEYLPPINY